MGCSKSKYDRDKEMRDNPFFVGPSLFINLKGGDLNKNYKIQEVLGKGAFGEVSLVIHLASGQKRAMKKLNKSNTIDEQLIASECQIMMYFDHPNIVKTYELYQNAKHYFIVYEYLSGGEILNQISKEMFLSEQKVATYIKQVLEALNHCHACGIIHRDIKPQNILLESEEEGAQLKLIDFGAAKKKDLVDLDTQGTPYYLAPEAIAGNSDEKSDVWSCGIMTLQLLTGKLPFKGQTDPTKVCKMTEDKILDFSVFESNRNLSEQCKQLLRKMLNYDPLKRCSIQQALEDPWIQKNKTNKNLDKEVLTNLQNFHSCSKLQQVILQLIASTMMSKDDKKNLIEQFKKMDKNGDGTLTHQELKAGYMNIYHDELKAEHIVEEILKNGDFNHSNSLDYSEFLVAASKYTQLVERQKIEKAFQLFDQDKNGLITIDELKKIMAGAEQNKNINQWKELISDFDLNRDGRIDHQEFINAMMLKMNN